MGGNVFKINPPQRLKMREKDITARGINSFIYVIL